MIKSHKMIAFVIVTVLFVFIGTIAYLSGFHIDLSQKYRTINGYENIIFKDSWNNQCYRLCTWGLAKTEDVTGFEDHRDFDTSSYEYRLIVERAGAEWIVQIVPSPEKNSFCLLKEYTAALEQQMMRMCIIKFIL